MGILPEINFDKVLKNLEKEVQEDNKPTLGKTFLIDFKKGKMLKRDGKLIKTDDERSVRMWIEKVLLTEKNKWKIYENTDYGMEYKANIHANRFPTPFLRAEFIRELDETMSKHPQILELRDLEIKMIRHTLHTKFKVILRNFKEFVWEADL